VQQPNNHTQPVTASPEHSLRQFSLIYHPFFVPSDLICMLSYSSSGEFDTATIIDMALVVSDRLSHIVDQVWAISPHNVF